MFGYVVVDKPELKVREFATYRSYYCGLCKAIGKEYSQVARLMLNYDCSFLYLLEAALSGKETEYRREVCPASPFRKKLCAFDEGADYAAAVNVLLAVGKLKDDAHDERQLAAMLAAQAYKRCYQKASTRYPETAQQIAKGLAEISRLEAEGCAEVDRMADAFGKMLGAVAAGIGKEQRTLMEIGYNLGRWIYLMDAVDDWDKDGQKGAYNPYRAAMPDAARSEVVSAAEFNLNCCMVRAQQAFDLLPIQKNQEILYNIFYLGMPKRMRTVLYPCPKKDGKKKTAGDLAGHTKTPVS